MKIQILGSGPSISYRRRVPDIDQIWPINSIGKEMVLYNKFGDDLAKVQLWWLDDFRWDMEKDNGEHSKVIEEYIDFLREYKMTAWTLHVHPEWKDISKAYPMDLILRYFGNDMGTYFKTSLAYQLAFAIALEVDEIYLDGCDLNTPDEKRGEEKMCVHFWLGMALGKGIRVSVNPFSHMLSFAERQGRTFIPYGWYPKTWQEKFGYDLWSQRQKSLRDRKQTLPTMLKWPS